MSVDKLAKLGGEITPRTFVEDISPVSLLEKGSLGAALRSIPDDFRSMVPESLVSERVLQTADHIKDFHCRLLDRNLRPIQEGSSGQTSDPFGMELVLTLPIPDSSHRYHFHIWVTFEAPNASDEDHLFRGGDALDGVLPYGMHSPSYINLFGQVWMHFLRLEVYLDSCPAYGMVTLDGKGQRQKQIITHPDAKPQDVALLNRGLYLGLQRFWGPHGQGTGENRTFANKDEFLKAVDTAVTPVPEKERRRTQRWLAKKMYIHERTLRNYLANPPVGFGLDWNEEVLPRILPRP
jgi:hypothetical protein